MNSAPLIYDAINHEIVPGPAALVSAAQPVHPDQQRTIRGRKFFAAWVVRQAKAWAAQNDRNKVLLKSLIDEVATLRKR